MARFVPKPVPKSKPVSSCSMIRNQFVKIEYLASTMNELLFLMNRLRIFMHLTIEN